MKAGVCLLVSTLVLLAACSSCSKQKHSVNIDWEHTHLDKIVEVDPVDNSETSTEDTGVFWCNV